MTSIGASAFSGCTALNNVNIPDTVTTIRELAFENCTSLTNIRLPKVVTSIGYDAFKDCTSLTSMNIPEGVTRLTTLFSDCTSLKSITIPSSVTYIDPMMVSGCTNLEKITVSPENKVYDSRDNCNAIIRNYTSNGAYLELGCKNTTIPKSVSVISNWAFSDNHCPSNLIIPDGVTVIAPYAFRNCTNLKHVTIPGSVVGIQDLAFFGCSNLTDVVLSEGVSGIGIAAFVGCNSLKSITIPDSVTRIYNGSLGYGADCWDFPYYEESIVKKVPGFVINGVKGSEAEKYAKKHGFAFNASQTDISKAAVSLSQNSYAYDGNAKRPSVTVTIGKKTLSLNTDYTVSYSNNTEIGTARVTVTGKGNYTGKVIKNFTISIENGTIFTVGAYKYKIINTNQTAFAGLKSNQTAKVNIPPTVIIGGRKFKVTSIAKNALKNSKVTAVTIGANVKTIDSSAFEGCKKLTTVTIGTGVSKIGANAFKNCKKLKKITVKSTILKTVGKNALAGIKSNARIKVPTKKLKKYQKLFKGKGQGKKVKVTK